jgi:colicin import membrane protein
VNDIPPQSDDASDDLRARGKSLPLVMVVLVFSFLLHIFLLIWFSGVYERFKASRPASDISYEIRLTMNDRSQDQPQEPEPQAVPDEPPQQNEVSEPLIEDALKPEPELPPQEQQQEQEQHNPMHTGDEPGSTNTLDKSQTLLVAGKPEAPEKNDAPENIAPPMETAAAPKEDAVESLSRLPESKMQENPQSEPPAAIAENSSKGLSLDVIPSGEKALDEKALDGKPLEIKSTDKVQPASNDTAAKPLVAKQTIKGIPAEFLERMGNIDLLDDKRLSSTRIEEPFSEIEARRLRMINLYLERMQKQIAQYWHKPPKELPLLNGIIKFELDPGGYLEEATIHRSSGSADLDVSALDAVRSVARFAVPESREVAKRYYQRLYFYYSSRESAVEEAPWESALEKQ